MRLRQPGGNPESCSTEEIFGAVMLGCGYLNKKRATAFIFGHHTSQHKVSFLEERASLALAKGKRDL
eukprot:CAMPEP_0172471312 /NCGR_PEP_ID=MMETSP1065-20121228/67750_1 /TAXON_ID=265537 /ORGANISM="Amphiprora paludosa, Strain CCMP125" /LENGTH=66 /DNA_ID=CAMNT_0013229407 /DNA_START=896 /DNA_END=1096 /DNA_ORIENTATION=+